MIFVKKSYNCMNLLMMGWIWGIFWPLYIKIKQVCYSQYKNKTSLLPFPFQNLHRSWASCSPCWSFSQLWTWFSYHLIVCMQWSGHTHTSHTTNPKRWNFSRVREGSQFSKIFPQQCHISRVKWIQKSIKQNCVFFKLTFREFSRVFEYPAFGRMGFFMISSCLVVSQWLETWRELAWNSRNPYHFHTKHLLGKLILQQ